MHNIYFLKMIQGQGLIVASWLRYKAWNPKSLRMTTAESYDILLHDP